jgi:uncharacterized delta-60 repeat protein
VLGALVLAASASAAEGALDPTFGSHGTVTASLASGGGSTVGNAVAIDAQDRVVTVGLAARGDNDFAIARYLPDGTPDPTFSGDGKVTYDILAGDFDSAQGVAIDSQGRIVVVGSTLGGGTGGDWAILRLLPDGSLDPSFTRGPGTSFSLGPGSDSASAVTLDPSGRILVAGRSQNGGHSDAVLARFKSDGTLDTSFDGDGKLVTNLNSNPSANQAPGDVVTDSQGRILTGDASGVAGGGFTVARYLDDGRLDTSFGGTGIRVIDVGVDGATVSALAVDPLGRIVVGGLSFANGSSQFTFARTNASGALDTSFSGDGIAMAAIPNTVGSMQDFALDSQGRIIAVGTARSSGQPHATVARFDEAGNLDASFGAGGFTTDPAGAQSAFSGVAVDGHDRIVAAGNLTRGDGSGIKDFVTSRYIDDETAPNVDIAVAEGAFFNSATPSITFSASQPASFTCGFDGATEPCTSPFLPAVPLGEGQHTFFVLASDHAGNSGSSTRTINIDTVAPDVDIKGKKKVETDKPKTRAKFKVKASEPATLVCHVDHTKPKPCKGKYKTPKLDDGKHKVVVIATDRAGNTASDKQKVKVVAN